jgi:FtsP/CotA-like multicopper oxidase with cupredoxin domain
MIILAVWDSAAQERTGYGGNQGLGMGTIGVTKSHAIGIDPTEYLTTWNFNNLPPDEREKYYRETTLADGQLLREYWLFATDREIEIMPGVFFPAWTYNDQVPGPTIRATEGDRIRVHFTNNGTRPHTIHFHGYHPEEMDGSMPQQYVFPGDTFLYEFDVAPFGIHLYHCHSTPLTQHIHKGLYGVFIIDPLEGRPPAQEVVMMMNGFDTNFDEDNEVYAVNSIAFVYKENPIVVSLGETLRIYLVNILEFDETNSFHVHANFFQEFRTGTSLVPDTFTDTVIFGQAERSILEIDFQFPGEYMFHAHKTEFAELGWMGLFRVVE